MLIFIRLYVVSCRLWFMANELDQFHHIIFIITFLAWAFLPTYKTNLVSRTTSVLDRRGTQLTFLVRPVHVSLLADLVSFLRHSLSDMWKTWFLVVWIQFPTSSSHVNLHKVISCRLGFMANELDQFHHIIFIITFLARAFLPTYNIIQWYQFSSYSTTSIRAYYFFFIFDFCVQSKP